MQIAPLSSQLVSPPILCPHHARYLVLHHISPHLATFRHISPRDTSHRIDFARFRMTISINEMKSKKKKKMKVPMNLRENRSFEIRLLKNMCGINDNIVKNIDNNREKNSNIES